MLVRLRQPCVANKVLNKRLKTFTGGLQVTQTDLLLEHVLDLVIQKQAGTTSHTSLPASQPYSEISKPCKGAVQVSHLQTPLETTFLKTKPLVLGPVPT